MITMSTVREKREGRVGEDYFAFFANPYDVTRTFILVVKEIVAEIWQQTQQRRLEIEPRVHRGWFPYPLLRSYTNVLQRELEVASTIQDLYSGRPVIYTMFLGYDEVAHHSGIERPETLRELRRSTGRSRGSPGPPRTRPDPIASSFSPIMASRRERPSSSATDSRSVISSPTSAVLTRYSYREASTRAGAT